MGPKNPPKRGVSHKILKLAYYRNYRIDSNQILHSHKDHQTPLVGGPITHTTKSNMAEAAILENRKIAISQPRFDLFR